MKAGSAGDAEQLAGRRGDFADRGLVAGADVERLAVVGRGQIERRVEERLGHVVDVDEIRETAGLTNSGYSRLQSAADQIGIRREESSRGP